MQFFPSLLFFYSFKPVQKTNKAIDLDWPVLEYSAKKKGNILFLFQYEDRSAQFVGFCFSIRKDPQL
jgi:hypothetical protein